MPSLFGEAFALLSKSPKPVHVANAAEYGSPGNIAVQVVTVVAGRNYEGAY